MKVSELILALEAMPPDASVHMGYDGNYVSVQPSGEVCVVQETDDFLNAHPGDVIIMGA